MRKHERKTIETVNTVTTQMTAEQKTENPTCTEMLKLAVARKCI